jgi:hypothetical protein
MPLDWVISTDPPEVRSDHQHARSMHSMQVRRMAVALVRSGVSNIEVADHLRVPVGTVGYWVHMDRARLGELPVQRRRLDCPRCDDAPLDASAYAYVLGLYLGDGHIGHSRRQKSPSLAIACADAWPGLMDLAEEALQSVFPLRSTCRVASKGCHNVKVTSLHVVCLFPQHGPGRKHERRIALESWQQEIVDAHPWPLIRGLIHSDGCRITNWTTRMVAGKRKRYEYPRYFFTNLSSDIIRLFTTALDQVDELLLKYGRCKKGDVVVITAGSPPGVAGGTNMVRVHHIGEDDSPK